MVENLILLAVGPVLFSVMFNWGLFGVFLVQIYIYIVWYHPTDRGAIRYIVYLLFVLECILTGLLSHTGWEILADRWGDPTILQNIPWSAAACPINTGAVATTVKLYFCWRIWLLGSNSQTARVISAMCALLSVVQWVAAITFSVKFIQQDMNITFLLSDQSRTIAIVWLISSTVGDVLIAASLVQILLVAKSHSLPHTGSLLNRLIIQTIQSGVVTAVFTTFHLIFYLAFPKSFIHVTFMYILGRLYANVFLTTLNSRRRIQIGGGAASQGIALPGDSYTLRSGIPVVSSGTKIGLFQDKGGIEMSISTVTHSDREAESRKDTNLSIT
ncbi:hypothetical protein BDZ94DRAFT_1246523 [Collybia nuda]|uniref:DUF6534 domain-containing protein n=1 Tax=Collybia nuda TaxID=64659 RepID=A0A9P5YGS8_9AGAR|nr:hypothetical protein BDZ94DRAFT_1246523 [Collybia nuda]